LITGYRDDWKAIEAGLVTAITEILKTNIRIYGNAAITEDFELLLKQPDQYSTIAHESYIKRAKTEQPQLLSSRLVRCIFDGVEFGDKDMRSILQQAAKLVPRTADEPSLIVRTIENELIVTFAH
jgi:ABC-type transport system involved in Fe-S cluster assembly fused permease/ATPase subunit